MLKSQIYVQLSEQIHCYCYGDSLHVRYIVMYTSFNRLYVIAENKYSAKHQTNILDWCDDPIIAMKYDTFKLHILTIKGNYDQLVLGEIFQEGFNIKQAISINAIKDAQTICSVARPQEIYKGFNDFVFYSKRIVFITIQGAAIFYDPEKHIIHLIVQLRVQLLQIQIIAMEGKDYIFAITEFNDLVKFSENEPEPQLHRFADHKYSIKQVFFVGQKCLLIHQENHQQSRFVKYKLNKLKFVKKIYTILKDDANYKYIDIIEIPKAFICLIFDQNKFKVIALSKQSMQKIMQKHIDLKLNSLMDENSQQFSLQDTFSWYETAIICMLEYPSVVLHIGKFNQTFGNKVTKSQVKNTLIQCQQDNYQILDKLQQQMQAQKYCSVMFTETQIYLINTTNIIQYKCNFRELQYYENYCNTYPGSELIPDTWQNLVIFLLWNKINSEQGVDKYVQNKQRTDSQIHEWVSSISSYGSLYDQFNNFSNKIQLNGQFNKCLATFILLQLTNLSNEITISIIVSLVFNKQFSCCGQIVRNQSLQFYKLLEYLRLQDSPIIDYQYWKYAQQLLFLLLIIFEVYLTDLMEQFQVASIYDDQSIPLIINKLKCLIQSTQVPLELRMKLIIFSKSQDYLKLFIMGVQQIKDKQNLLNLAISCNLLINKPSFNIHSIKMILQDCPYYDQLYLNNLIKLSSNIDNVQLSMEQQLQQPINANGLIMMKMITDVPVDNDYYKLIQWFYD